MNVADEVMLHEEAAKTAEDEKMQLEKVKKTAAEDALRLEMVTPDSEASYETEDGGDASEQEASHHPTDDDDEYRSMSEERERNDIGRVPVSVRHVAIGESNQELAKRNLYIFANLAKSNK